jgi:two-component system response regulator HydG
MSIPHGPRVLVVDDEDDACRNLSDILTDLGYRVDCACDGPAALELVRRTPYDVALLDLRMPGMDGLTLYREIKKLRAGTVALLVTAYASGATAEEALGAGAWRVVPKPVDLPGLLGLVDEAMGQPLVLVVDDDRELCENLWRILREHGYRVALAHDGAGAAGQLRDATYRVVLIDMKLPGGDGGEVFRMARRADPRSRTLLITGSRRETDRLIGRVLAEGADGVCYKPFDVPKFLEQVGRLAHAHDGATGDTPPSGAP